MPEPKNARWWIDKGYKFMSLSNCPACSAPTETWLKNNTEILLDAKTMESHFAGCPRAREYRTEQQMRAGVLL